VPELVADPLETAKSIVEGELKKVFDEAEGEAYSISNMLSDLTWIIRDFTLRGGKRFRAALALAGYWSKVWAREINEDARKVMASIELLQSYLLIHDDIMDRDEIRRGGPTAYAWLRDKCVKDGLETECLHYGVSQAITAGDLLESMAVRVLSSTSPDISRRLVQKYTEGLMKVAFGQFLDVYLSSLPLNKVGEAEVILVHKLKTASYTVELPLHLGAIASRDGDERLLAELSAYAIPAGIAFQLRDDIIGLYGKPAVTGKPVGSDVLQRKKTLLVVKAYENGGEHVRRLLEEIYSGRRNVTSSDVEFVKRVVEETGALDYSLKRIEHYVSEAEKAIGNMKETCQEAREFLSRLLNKLAYREL
jgi:geranylgeranyl diphosphate synthase type I